ncbi:hypothetical protein IMCC20628_00121 [Hoeflea sp. IMCC20628]|nr:hypothetical protein IMCC20628_00121 [Hoeflea sp. IMCC20628]
MEWIFRVSQENTAAAMKRIVRGFDDADVENSSRRESLSASTNTASGTQWCGLFLSHPELRCAELEHRTFNPAHSLLP